MNTSLRTNWRVWTVVIAFGALVIVVISALDTSRATSAPLERVVFADATQMTAASAWVAEAKGYFRDEGVDVQVRRFEFGRQAFAEMLLGRADVATVAATPFVLASFTRRDFVVFANMSYSDNDVKIIARRDRHITKAADLRGKTVAASKGTSAEYFLEAFLANYGVPRQTLVIRDLDQPALAEALAKGEVDAVAAFEPFALKARKRLGSDAVVITAPEVYRETFNLAARRDFAEARPQALVKFLRAIERGQKFILANPGEARQIMVRRTGLSPEEVAAIMPDFTYSLSLHQSLISLFEDEARWAIRQRRVSNNEVPNYLDLIYPDAMRAIRPGAVTIIH